MDLLPKASNVALVLQCGGLWFINGKFGVTWKLVQGMVRPRATLRGKCHIKLGSSDRAVLEKQAEREAEEAEKQDDSVFEQTENATAVEDSEEEEEPTVAQEVAAEVKPKKVVKKKVVRRKKTAAAE